MARSAKGASYHHGDLRAALIDTAIDLIAERGVRNFSLAEASRRLGVAVSAPYAHFADRDQLLAAVKVNAYETLAADLLPGLSQLPDPADRLAAMARGYVRFAVARRPLFEVLYYAGIDKVRYPEVEAAERPVNDAFLACVAALSDDADDADGSGGAGRAAADDLATAIEATAHGHAMLLLDGDFGDDPESVDEAAERAARATLALVHSRHLLSPAASRATGAP